MVVITESQGFNTDAFEKHLKQVSTVPVCGNMPGPMSFCQGIKEKESYEFFPITLACRYVVHVVVACLIIDYVAYFVKKHFLGDKAKYKQLGGAAPPFFETKGTRRGLVVFWVLLGIMTISMIFVSLTELLQLLDMHSADGGVSTWAFGQLVAVTIWFPVAIKFLALNIGKCKSHVFISNQSLIFVVGPRNEVKRSSDQADGAQVELVDHSYRKITP
jgi:hypothetical protein